MKRITENVKASLRIRHRLMRFACTLGVALLMQDASAADYAYGMHVSGPVDVPSAGQTIRLGGLCKNRKAYTYLSDGTEVARPVMHYSFALNQMPDWCASAVLEVNGETQTITEAPTSSIRVRGSDNQTDEVYLTLKIKPNPLDRERDFTVSIGVSYELDDGTLASWMGMATFTIRQAYGFKTEYDLVFSRPSGWTQSFFLAKDKDSRTPVTSFRTGEAIYANFGFGNSFADSYSGFVNCIALGSTTVWSEYYPSSAVFDGAETYFYTKNLLLADLQDLAPGTYTLVCTLNAMGDLEETDASNNTRSVTFTVLPADAAGGRLCEDVGGAAGLSSATTYSGYLVDGDGWVAGTIQVKAAKAKTNRKTGVTTSKLAVTIQPAGGKKLLLKGDLDVEAGAISITAKDGRALDLEIGADGIAGTFGDWEIDGARDVFSSKAAADKTAAADALAKWQGTTLALLFDAAGGSLTVTVAARGRAKVSGTLSDGTKLNASAQMVVGGEWCCVPVVFVRRNVNLAFCLWLSADGETADVTGLGEDVLLGRPSALGANAKLVLDANALANLIGDGTYRAYFPNGVSVAQRGMKWVVADGAKAGKVVLGRDGAVDAAKAGANPSALKLSYRAKDGSFSGSFKAYVDSRGKPKAVTVSVSGVVIDGVGYGTATVKKLGSVPVTIE